ncbi:MAG: fibronectin type III domain-containing protein [Acetobacter sp.]|nr:fibronectin type III domain-containing protein [Bacteroides sp.]MCM1340707.1 fibronectin type III domain-containing protein [Acetobacter sp.]MCM1433818.1 fibronectin type III domain-containing protein [Clostridiales bacterium]
MKKTISILLSVVMLIGCTCIMPFSASADSVNTAATAKTISVGSTTTTFKYGYPDGTYDKYVYENEIYFKFIPAYTGYFEFQATGYEKTKYIDGQTPYVSIGINDINGKTVGGTYTNEFNLITKKAFQLTKGQTYYITLYDSMSEIASYKNSEYGYAQQNITLKISAHSHSLVTENYSSFNYIECQYCDYNAYDYNVGTVKSVTLGKTSFVYNGKVQTPSVIAKDTNGKTISKSAYTVSISGNKKSVGTYTVTVKFGSGYKNAVKKVTYKIVPKSTSLSKLTSGKKKFTVKWKKQTSQTTGYQIQYSTSSKFKSAKTVTVSKNKTTSKSVSKLKAKKKYYVRVRTYKTVKVNGKNTNIYSSWSKAKAVTTKK